MAQAFQPSNELAGQVLGFETDKEVSPQVAARHSFFKHLLQDHRP